MVQRDKVEYRDSTPFDQSKLQSLQTIKDALLHKRNAKDVRAPMAQMPDAFFKALQDGADLGQLGALAELVEARGGFETLGIHEAAQDNDIQNAQASAINADSKGSHAVALAKQAASGSPRAAFKTFDELKQKYPNGADGTYVVEDTGHWFYYYNDGWLDGGKWQSTITNAIEGNADYLFNELPKAPFDNLNSLPLNSIVSYGSHYNEIKNIPFNNNDGATVMTIAYSSDDKNNTGAVQLLWQPNGQSAYRVNWGGNNTWKAWHSQGNAVTGLGLYEKEDTKKMDLDKLAYNSVVTISFDTTKTINFPVDGYSGGATIATLAYAQYAAGGGAVQLAFLANGREFRRIKWGEPPVYGSWHENKLNGLAGDRIITEAKPATPYNDLDNLGNNSVVVYSDLSNIQHVPDQYFTGGANILTLSYGDVDGDGAGRVQLFMQPNGTFAYRFKWGAPASWQKWFFMSRDYRQPNLALFENIGVVGDSYASGFLVKPNGDGLEHYNISWPQIMARKNGIKAVNFSKGGLTTRSWLTSDKGLELLKSNDPQDLYIIALGINDKNISNYLGVVDDMGQDKDTFYGNYAKIIEAIKNKAPKAKIILMTTPFWDGSSALYNNAIGTIGAKLGLPVIWLQNDKGLINSDYFQKGLVGGHPTALLYSSMADSFENLIKQKIVDSPAYWQDYQLG